MQNSELDKLDIPSGAFIPDEWTKAFQDGLKESGLEGCVVLEVGVGTGVNIKFLIEQSGVKKIYGSDLDPSLPQLASDNMDKLLSPEDREKFVPIHGSISLLNNAQLQDMLKELDVIVACIPQAIRPENVEPSADDMAHYYPKEVFDKNPYNSYALGLNEELLRDAKKIAPETPVILNLGGRVGQAKLLELFTYNGYKPEILHTEIIPQHPGTNLEFYAELESSLDGTTDSPFKCEFFSDSEGNELITAQKAEKRRLNKEEVFHKIYVIRGVPQSD